MRAWVIDARSRDLRAHAAWLASVPAAPGWGPRVTVRSAPAPEGALPRPGDVALALGGFSARSSGGWAGWTGGSPVHIAAVAIEGGLRPVDIAAGAVLVHRVELLSTRGSHADLACWSHEVWSRSADRTCLVVQEGQSDAGRALLLWGKAPTWELPIDHRADQPGSGADPARWAATYPESDSGWLRAEDRARVPAQTAALAHRAQRFRSAAELNQAVLDACPGTAAKEAAQRWLGDRARRSLARDLAARGMILVLVEGEYRVASLDEVADEISGALL